MGILVFRLLPGSDLKTAIEQHVKANNIQAGWINACVGSLTNSHIRFANQPSGTNGTGFYEIVSLTGTVSVNGCHLHIAISDAFGKTSGGHLLEGNIVYTTAEVVIGYDATLVFKREADAATGYKELTIQKSLAKD